MERWRSRLSTVRALRTRREREKGRKTERDGLC